MQKQIHDLIKNNYEDIVKYCIFVSSDWTRDLKFITPNLNAIHGIDKYHVLNKI